MSDSEVKKVASPFIRFSKVHRKKLHKENPQLSFGKISSLIGSKWRTLPAKEKQVYIDEYEKEEKIRKKTISKMTKTKHKHKNDKKAKKSKQAKKQKRNKEGMNSTAAGSNGDAIVMDNYYTDLQNVSDWHTNPSFAMQAEQPWPMNMYPQLFFPPQVNTDNLQNLPLQMPPVFPISTPLPTYLPHIAGDIGLVSDGVAIPNHYANLSSNADINDNISTPEVTSVSSDLTPIPTGIYTSEYYDEIVSKTGVSEIEQEEKSDSPNNVAESDVIEID